MLSVRNLATEATSLGLVLSLPATSHRCVSRSLPQWCLHRLCTNARDQGVNPRDRRFLGLLALQWSEVQTHVDDRCVFIAGRSRDHHGAGAMRAMRAMRIVHEKNNVIYRFVHLRRVASLLRPVQTPTRQLWAEWFAQSMNDLLSNFLQCQSLPDCAASHQFYQQHKRHWNTCLYIPVYILIL